MAGPLTVGERVRIAAAGHVATVTLARSEKHNALDLAMFDALHAAIARLGSEPDLRAVVLHGDGPSFCGGVDVAAFGADGVGSGDRLVQRMPGTGTTYAQRVTVGWRDSVPVPVIAAIHGSCLGGGLQIALGADIRIAAPDAQLALMEVRWGLMPDMGVTQTLPRLVGVDVAKELTFTGRRISGEEAARLGLVTRVAADPLAAARELAGEIAAQSPEAVRSAKRLYDQAWTRPDGGLALEAQLGLALLDARR